LRHATLTAKRAILGREHDGVAGSAGCERLERDGAGAGEADDNEVRAARDRDGAIVNGGHRHGGGRIAAAHLTTQRQQHAVETEDAGVRRRRHLLPHQPARLEGFQCLRIGNTAARGRVGELGEVGEFVPPSRP